MTDTRTESQTDPEALEREVERTQDDIGDTIEKIEDKLNPRDIGRSLLGEDGSDVAREALEVTRSNPIPVAMIALGVIWLLATTDSPAIRAVRDRIMGSVGGGNGLRSRSEEPAPIGPPPATGEKFDRRS